MGIPREPDPVKLVVGLLSAVPQAMEAAATALAENFGPVEARLGPIPFSQTAYYAREMGSGVMRSWLAFSGLISRSDLPDVKIGCNSLESRLSRDGSRTVNVDPGYLTPDQLFLASTKDRRQRVYVRDGIYIEPTLYFRSGAFHPFEWTYPDYREDACLGFLAEARQTLLRQLRSRPAED